MAICFTSFKEFASSPFTLWRGSRLSELGQKKAHIKVATLISTDNILDPKEEVLVPL